MITKYHGKGENVSIPPTIRGEKVTEIGDSAFESYNGGHPIYSIIIPNDITKIGESAFSGQTLLTNIQIPNSVTEIGDLAFSVCKRLPTITIPNSVTVLGKQCFGGCENLTNVTLSNNMTSIGYNTFGGCIKLTNITIPVSVVEIDTDVFQYCLKLTSINVDSKNPKYTSIDGVLFSKDKTKLIYYPEGKTAASYSIPDNVTEIEDEAFFNSQNLKSITIPNSITKIGKSAFRYCKNIKSINISDSLIEISNTAFNGCTSLTSINVGSNNPHFSSVDGVLFNKDKTKLVHYPSDKPDKSYTIPDSVIEICENSFDDCDNLISLIIPDSVTSICGWAISYCDNLVDVKIPDNAALTGSGVRFNNEPLLGNCNKIQAVYKGQTYDYRHLRDLIKAMPKG